MRNVWIVLLATLLAAASITGFTSYWKYREMKKALSTSAEKMVNLNEKINRLNEERSTLQEKARQGAEPIKVLEREKKRVSQLEDVIRSRDMEISGLEQKVHQLESALKEDQKGLSEMEIGQLKSAHDALISSLGRQISDKDEQNDELQKKVWEYQGRVISLREKIVKDQTALKNIRQNLSKIDGW